MRPWSSPWIRYAGWKGTAIEATGRPRRNRARAGLAVAAETASRLSPGDAAVAVLSAAAAAVLALRLALVGRHELLVVAAGGDAVQAGGGGALDRAAGSAVPQ